jgi:hypothetical protein
MECRPPESYPRRHLLNFGVLSSEVFRQADLAPQYTQRAPRGPRLGVCRDYHHRLASAGNRHRLAARQNLFDDAGQVRLGFVDIYCSTRLSHIT